MSVHERDAVYSIYRENLAQRRRRGLAALAACTFLVGSLGFLVGHETGQAAAYTSAGLRASGGARSQHGLARARGVRLEMREPTPRP